MYMISLTGPPVMVDVEFKYNQMRENPILDGNANDLCLLVVQSLRMLHVPGF